MKNLLMLPRRQQLESLEKSENFSFHFRPLAKLALLGKKGNF
jgi:hypothetical protein